MKNIFNVRVYGIVLNEKNEVLLTDEHVYSMDVTKFPGGGMQFGEGTIDCLKREFMEELKMEVSVIKHFYTTDFFQPSFIDPSQQVISIYYIVTIKDIELITISALPFDFSGRKDGMQSFRWMPLSEAGNDTVTFPIDRKVLHMLKEEFTTYKALL